MYTYELTHKILSIGAAYEVRDANDAVVSTIRGKVLSATPQLSMFAGDSDASPPTAFMKGNFMKTKFDVFDGAEQSIGTLSFPMLALKKTFTLETGGEEYKADGGVLAGAFTCKNARGDVVLTISKELSLRDKFAVATSGAISPQVALLVAVAIDQRFFQEV